MLSKAYYSRTLLITISLGTLALATAGTATAGFEWVPGTPSAPQKPHNKNIKVQKAPVANVSGEHLPDAAGLAPEKSPQHTNEIIHVTPKGAQSQITRDVMTPSPFDTVANKPESVKSATSETTPEPIINTIDMTTPAPEQVKEASDVDKGRTIEQVEAKNLDKTEEVINLPSASADMQDAEKAVKQHVQDEGAPAIQQPQKLAPLPVEDNYAEKRIIINTHPDKPTKPALKQPKDKTEFADAMGFGKDMPLALAVQQILPPGYAFSFAESVNPGTRVSWNGGKQWNLVLLETLEPLGLKARIDDNIVAIIRQREENVPAPSKPEQAKDQGKGNKQANIDLLSIEPASGTERPEGIAAGTSENIITSRLTIRDPGQKEGQQPALGQYELLKPVSEQKESIILPLGSDHNTDGKKQSKATTHDTWTAHKGDSLKKVIYSWAEKANIQIVWEASHDYILNADFSSSEPVSIALENLMNTALRKDAIPSYRMLNTDMSKDQMALVIIQDSSTTNGIKGNLTAG